jgi:hypothetical protein
MQVTAPFGEIFIGSIAYLILTAQVASGFPPFYKSITIWPPWSIETSSMDERLLMSLALVAFGIIASVMVRLAVQQSVFFGFAGLLGFLGGWISRRYVHRNFGLPVP